MIEATALQAEFMRVCYPPNDVSREETIGGSDVAAIMGIHPYCAREQKMREKLGLEPAFAGNWATKLGQATESMTLAEYAQRTGRKVLVSPPPPAPTPSALRVVCPKRDWLRGSLDGFVEPEKIVVEAKLVGPAMAKKWGAEGTDQIPIEYVAQVALYMALANAEQAHVVGLLLAFGLSKVECKIYEVKRDLEFEARMFKAVDEFRSEWTERKGEIK